MGDTGYMKSKSTIILIILLLIGLLIGSIIGELLSDYIPILNKSQQITWEPKGDLVILKYDLSFQVKINLTSVIGLIIAFWVYKKL